jgi:acetylornithine aminotransferase
MVRPPVFIDNGKVIEPDVMTLAKAVGGGLPVGIMYAQPEAAKLMVPGTHGCTLGANPICMAVSRTVFDVIERENLLEHVQAMGNYAVQRLANEPRIANKLAAIRGKGLMLGIELKDAAAKLVEKGLERGIVINLTAGKVIRLAPPVNIPRQLWEQGLEGVVDVIAAM